MARVLTSEIIKNIRQGCKSQPSHPRCSSLSVLYILPWFEAQLPIGFEYEPRGFGLFGLIFDQNLPSFENRVLVRIELRGAIVELARKRKWPRAFGLVSIVFGY